MLATGPLVFPKREKRFTVSELAKSMVGVASFNQGCSLSLIQFSKSIIDPCNTTRFPIPFRSNPFDIWSK